jgi:hypothetical protein
VSQSDDDDSYLVVTNLGDHAVVADPVLPEATELVTLECIAEQARVGSRRNALAQERDD